MKIIKYIFVVILFVSNTVFSCTIFDTKNLANETLVGRNFDWLHTKGQINFTNRSKNKYGFLTISLNNPNMPYEGMNDKGLFVAVSAVPNTDTTVNILKPIRKSLEMVKIVLETSSNTQEAIRQFKKYSIAFGQFLGNPLIHFKVVQKDGQSIIIEFVNSKMIIINDNSKVMTNHYLSDTTIKSSSKTTHARYDIISRYQKNTNTVKTIFEGLQKVSQKNTVWSNVYNLATQEVYIKYKNNKIKKYNLKDELYSNKPHFYSLKNINKKQKLTANKSNLRIKLHFGYGQNSTKYYGLKFLLSSSDIQSYGLEFTKFTTDDDDFKAIGIILEQRLWQWFGMSIGTIGYFDYGATNDNVIGLVLSSGWEPNNHIPFHPFIKLRNDIIFTKDTKRISSIIFGMTFDF